MECGMEKDYATPKVQKKHLWVDYSCFGWVLILKLDGDSFYVQNYGWM
jgi:hypothetical protein